MEVIKELRKIKYCVLYDDIQAIFANIELHMSYSLVNQILNIFYTLSVIDEETLLDKDT
jgi:hypothetical protein